MITCVLISAGLSERFGSPKALARLKDVSIIEHMQKTLLESACDQIIVVLGAHAREIEPSIFIHSRIRVVYNKDYNFGQTSSVQAGWKAVDDASLAALLLPVDCPLVKASSIDQLIAHFKKHEPDILVPAFRGKKGHPPLFHRRLKAEILGLPLDQGLNALLARHQVQTLDIEDKGIVQSFNTPQEFEEIKKED